MKPKVNSPQAKALELPQYGHKVKPSGTVYKRPQNLPALAWANLNKATPL